MVKNERLFSLWIELKQFIEPQCEGLTIITDEPGDWRVETTTGRPFLTLRIQKSHVGLYLLPMYYHQHIRPKSMDAFHVPAGLPEEGIREILERARTMIGTY